jgi:hypothetical protein
MTVTVREAKPSDVQTMVALSEHKRTEAATCAPHLPIIAPTQTS